MPLCLRLDYLLKADNSKRKPVMAYISVMNDSQNTKTTTKFAKLIRERLAALKAENALGKSGQSIVELDQQAVGRLSRMDALQNQAMALAQQTRRDNQTRRLNAALARIDAGEYGYCDDCGEDIAPKRLQLDPAASKCISCASG